MATYNFSNIVGVGVGQFVTAGYGKMNFPILYLDHPLNAGDVWAANQGTSPGMITAEFSVVRDKVSGTSNPTHCITADGVTINVDGNATLRRSGGSYIFTIASVSVTSGFSTQNLIETTAPFTAIKGTNGVYSIGSGTWSGNSTQIVYQSCSIGQQGYATYYALLKGGTCGPLSTTFNMSQSTLSTVTEWITTHTSPPSTDPYGQGGESGTGGGTGTFGGTGDIVGVPTLPTLSAVNTGFITLFKPSITELNGLANYLWGSLFDISTWKKVFADPMDAILGLSIIPVNPLTSGSANIVVGNIQTSISMPKISSQYVEVDCGTLNIEEYWGAYLDYSPYTKFELYLPYIGTHPISADDIMSDTIKVVYHVDVLSGACVAYVLCGGTIIYTFIGQCSSSIPITGNDWTNVINGTISIAGAIGSMVATGGATAPLVAPGIASTVTNCIKPEIEKSGAMSGTGGMLGVQTPYLIVTRPKQCVAKNQNKMIGYPSHIYRKLSDVVGYTEILSIHLQGVAATDDELTEIVSLLQNGVIF